MTKPLRVWRSEQLLSTRKLAAEAGISNKTVVQIENGRQTPTFATMEKITNVLRVEPAEVTEFALALAERAREPIDLPSIAPPIARPDTSVLCVSSVAAFLTVTRRLLQADRYGVMTAISVSLTADQVACLRPDLLILDLGADARSGLTLLQQLQDNPSTARIPVIVTGRDRRRLGEMLADMSSNVTPVPYDRDLRGLLDAVASLTDTHATATADRD